jgi:hypothetical protein
MVRVVPPLWLIEPSGSTPTDVCRRIMRRRDGGRLRYFWRPLYEEVGGVVAAPASSGRRGIAPILRPPRTIVDRAGATGSRLSVGFVALRRRPRIPTPSPTVCECAALPAFPHALHVCRSFVSPSSLRLAHPFALDGFGPDRPSWNWNRTVVDDGRVTFPSSRFDLLIHGSNQVRTAIGLTDGKSATRPEPSRVRRRSRGPCSRRPRPFVRALPRIANRDSYAR